MEQGEEAASKKSGEMDELGENEDEIEYEIYYDLDEIRDVKEAQRQNAFDDLIDERINLELEYEGIDNLKAQNKYNIADYMPKDPEEDAKKAKGPSKEQ